ncbi:MAG TPA: HEPN domain-containing protein [Bacteroides sp.]|nr:HEPN domain-containing protein [Bacteroides sp.]
MNQEKFEYIKNWLYRAREDLAVLKDLQNSNPTGFTSSICFHAQQSVEKYLKAFLAYHDFDFPRTHDVDYLLIECQKIDDESLNIDLKSLTEFGVSIRYPDDFYVPTPEESSEYVEIAITISEIIEKLITIPE